jgi:hypothetical protein
MTPEHANMDAWDTEVEVTCPYDDHGAAHLGLEAA